MADDTTDTTLEEPEVVEPAAPTPVSDTVRALLVERAGYLRQGKTERAALVDEQLRLRGYADATVDGKPLIGDAPKPATARGRRTAKG